MIRSIISCLVIAVVFGDSLGKNPTFVERIAGGTSIDITQVPYQVSLQTAGYHTCGGSILNQLHVLTAAHCTIGLLVLLTTVRVGSTTISQGGQVIGVESISDHPAYNQLFHDYDYSVLKLKNPLQYSDSVQPISLPSQGQQIPDGIF
ncbi:trypsin [Sergentomyia squamirostris]